MRSVSNHQRLFLEPPFPQEENIDIVSNIKQKASNNVIHVKKKKKKEKKKTKTKKKKQKQKKKKRKTNKQEKKHTHTQKTKQEQTHKPTKLAIFNKVKKST